MRNVSQHTSKSFRAYSLRNHANNRNFHFGFRLRQDSLIWFQIKFYDVEALLIVNVFDDKWKWFIRWMKFILSHHTVKDINFVLGTKTKIRLTIHLSSITQSEGEWIILRHFNWKSSNIYNKMCTIVSVFSCVFAIALPFHIFRSISRFCHAKCEK